MSRADEPGRRAIALAYGEGDVSPRVLAKGYGELADRIVDEARRQGIYVHGAPELVSLLMQLDVDEHIPQQLYQVIAELLVWVGELQQDAAPAADSPAA